MSRSRRATAILVSVAFLALAAMPAASAAWHEGRWVGETSQGRIIKFRVNASAEITFLKVVIEVAGMTGCVVTWTSRNIEAPIRDDGTFVVKGSDGLDTVVVKGELLSRRRAEGTAKTSLVGECIGKKKVTWEARR